MASLPAPTPASPALTQTANLTIDEGDRLRLSERWLGNRNAVIRLAGTSLLAGMASPEALRLLERACLDPDDAVQEEAVKAILRSAATGRPEAETLLRALTQGSERSRVEAVLQMGKTETVETPREGESDALRFAFLAANPDLARCRLRCLVSGTAEAAQASRSARLRANHSFAALFDVIRADPDLSRCVKAVLSRRAEFQKGAGGAPRTLEPFAGQSRRMTGLLAALGTDPNLATLVEVVIDRSVGRASDALWVRLQTEIPYVPEVVVGAGPHGANLSSALATLRPDCLPLVVERRGRIGGQFAAPGGAAWLLNSRARAASPDRRSVPGGDGALNSLGAYAPVQEADLAGQTYAAQERLALATRMCLFLSCHALVETTVGPRFKNDARTRERLGLPVAGDAAPAGRYLVRLTREDTGAVGYVATDALIFAGGLGKPKTAFADRRSREAIREDRARSIQGKPGCYYTFEDFMGRLAGEGEPFPLRGIKRAIVVGGGDSGRVVAEALLGYGPPSGRTLHSLDRVEQVVWVGQKAATREAFLSCERPRYHGLALEFPREGNGSQSSGRILPVSERALRFCVETGEAVVYTTGDRRFVGDVVIDCAGFGDARDARNGGSPQALAELPASRAARLRPGSRLRLCELTRENFEIEVTVQKIAPLKSGDARRFVSGVVEPMIRNVPVGEVRLFAIGPCAPGEIGAVLGRAVSGLLRLPEDTELFLAKTVLPLVYATVNGERQPIARRAAKENVYYVGPEASLPGADGNAAKGVGGGATSRENAVALWRYAPAVTAFAEHYFANLASRPLQERGMTGRFEPEFLVQDLPPAPPWESPDTVVVAAARVGRMRVAAGDDTERLLRYLVCEQLRAFRLPASFSRGIVESLWFRFTPLLPEAGGEPMRIRSEAVCAEFSPLLRVAMRPLLTALASDAAIQEILLAWGESTENRGRTGLARPTEIKVLARRGRLCLQSLQRL